MPLPLALLFVIVGVAILGFGADVLVRGVSDLSVGNVVGSNIFNIAVVLGCTALIQPMRVHSSAVRMEWPFLFLVSFQLLLLARDGTLDRLEGAFFVIGLILFPAYAVWVGRAEVGTEAAADFAEQVERRDAPEAMQTIGKALLLVLAGIVLLTVGGETRSGRDGAGQRHRLQHLQHPWHPGDRRSDAADRHQCGDDLH